MLEAKLTYPRFLRTMEDDPEFRDRVISIERSLLGRAMMVIYGKAVGENNLDAATRYVQLATARKASAFSSRLHMLEYQLKKKAVDAQLDMGMGRKPIFRMFTNDELADYEMIHDKLRSGQAPTTDELTRFGAYSARLVASSSGAGEAVVRDFVGEVAAEALQPTSPDRLPCGLKELDATFSSPEGPPAAGQPPDT